MAVTTRVILREDERFYGWIAIDEITLAYGLGKTEEEARENLLMDWRRIALVWLLNKEPLDLLTAEQQQYMDELARREGA